MAKKLAKLGPGGGKSKGGGSGAAGQDRPSKPKKQKVEPGAGPAAEPAAPPAGQGSTDQRLDWSSAKLGGRDGGKRKDKFLRLMGGAKRGDGATSGAGAVGTVASLASKVAPKSSKFLSSGLFSGSSGGHRGSKVDVNMAYGANRGLARQFDQAQDLLKMKRRAGGKMGFSM